MKDLAIIKATLIGSCVLCGEASMGSFDCDRDEVPEKARDSFSMEQYSFKMECVNCKHIELFSAGNSDFTISAKQLNPIKKHPTRIEQ